MSAHYVIFEEPEHLLHLPAAVYGWSLLTALLFTVVPAFMMSAGVRRIGSAKAAGIGMIGPVATVAVAACFLGEAVSVLQIFGLLVVMAGIHRLHRV
jgi:drug/metabolite transporter (DMT)-like permease